jgi:hypothetical protein
MNKSVKAGDIPEAQLQLPRKRISDKPPSDEYLDDLEARLDKRFKPCQDFDDLIFIKSPLT